jgi:hypothetical protein
MNKLTIIKQGESLPFSFDRGENSISGWTCTISVKEKPADAAILSRVVAPSDGAWTGFLTQTETAALPVLSKGAPYYLIAKLSNTSTDEEEIITARFKISTAWA